MSYGFAIYRDDGTTKMTEDGGLACFIGQSTQETIPLNGLNPDWVWFAVSVFVSDAEIHEWNMPCNLCYLSDGAIHSRRTPWENATVIWGIA